MNAELLKKAIKAGSWEAAIPAAKKAITKVALVNKANNFWRKN
jgi:hypothetical protein